MKPGYGRVLARTLRKYPQFRSRGESWAFRSAGAFPSLFLIGATYSLPGSPLAAIAAAVTCFVLLPFVGAWWLHEGRERYPLGAAAVERIQARADRKQRRQERRAEGWRAKPLA